MGRSGIDSCKAHHFDGKITKKLTASLPLIMDGWKTRNTFLLGREAYFQLPTIRFLECIQYPYRQIFPKLLQGGPRADRYKWSCICNPL